jgi:hypothetical protein
MTVLEKPDNVIRTARPLREGDGARIFAALNG